MLKASVKFKLPLADTFGWINNKLGGDLEKDYKAGKIHPLDLKNTVAKELIEMITPIRTHFEKNKKAKKLCEEVKSYHVTR